MNRAVIWHDVECAAYGADLKMWEALAADAAGPVLDIGCGSGRVALHLARRGFELVGVDSDPDLVEALNARARGEGLPVRAHVGDVRALAMERTFALAIAPMQVVQLLGTGGRAGFLSALRAHLELGSLAALALADPLEDVDLANFSPPLPDVRESEGWVYSSQPLAVRVEESEIVIDRLRQSVSPAGDLDDEFFTISLDRLTAEELSNEASDHGFEATECLDVPETEAYVGSTIVLLEAI